MLGMLTAGAMSVGAIAFDMTSVLALMYPGRERVEVTATDGQVYVYACKPGPGGEPPQEQAKKAQEVFEVNTAKFVQVMLDDMTQDIESDQPSLQGGIDLSLKTNSWANAIVTHLDREYGCALLG
jgi:hypothetical protein